MQPLVLIHMTDPTPRKRRARKKTTYAITYRLSSDVKAAMSELAEIYSRSENLQVEYSLKIAYLHSKGINIYGMTELQIIEKFNEMTVHLRTPDELE